MGQIIYKGTPRSLPYTFDFTPDSDLPVLIHLSGSVYSGTANTKIGLEVAIGGKQVTSGSIFSNGPQTHRAINAGLSEYTFTLEFQQGQIKPVSVTISALNSNTIFDGNDEVTVAIW